MQVTKEMKIINLSKWYQDENIVDRDKTLKKNWRRVWCSRRPNVLFYDVPAEERSVEDAKTKAVAQGCETVLYNDL